MTNTNATNLRKNLFNYLETAIDFNEVININTKKGNAILISETEYNGLLETLYLLSIPGMKDKLIDGLNTPIGDCEELEW
ncbi:MAG: type II toxin-antitoxin system Phd/YefM family antitoxin [Fusobacterium gastrosuis]|uniref:type II toxin-antitoxin system Phd/YefM family antitoxin n=1 Tax=Fusobacterium gastrosuis TaxID=1755100 RepID=UPI002A99B00C|nr:type II toxin-antitoxin system Phd/YefM family antitoxin [Fusobacteriaceae bacterium]MDY5794857.1 type II toxin-antitoxin system Phd/YefM family antitoxin [Fusobacterium gastrosuis]